MKWINIEEKQPKYGDVVIAFEPHCYSNPDRGIDILVVDKDFFDKKSDGTFWITHWMYAPEPPVPKDKNKKL
jgi:hypothetical protein